MKQFLLGLALLLFAGITGHTQQTTQAPRIAVFAPLYLDSAYNELNEYRYGKNVFPKFINPGLEFYEGVQMALDSLSREGINLEVFVFDTRSATQSLEQQLSSPQMEDIDLVIAHCSSNEVRAFSEFGYRKQVPVINTTIPNDAGTQSNPFFVLLNPTLKTQVEGIYRYIQKYYSLQPVVVFRKKGATEDHIRSVLDEFSKTSMGSPIKLKYVDLIDSFTVSQLRAHLDSTRQNVCLVASLDINFGRRIGTQLAGISKSYRSTIIGMPTWESIREFTRPEFKGPEFIYSNPFYNAKTDRVSQLLTTYFNNTMYARPSDMVFRGYEVTWKYARLLIEYGKDIASNLGNKQFSVFTDFDIQPVLSKGTMNLQYFENKRLYFIKWQDGLIRTVNY